MTCNGTGASATGTATAVRSTGPSPAARRRSGCGDVTLTADTAGTEQGCIVRDGPAARPRASRSRSRSTARRRPSSPAPPSRPPDHDGWYSAPVDVRFSGADALSGLASCTAGSYAGPDTAAARVTGTCADVAGNRSAPFTFPLRYDATAPPDGGRRRRPARPGRAAVAPVGPQPPGSSAPPAWAARRNPCWSARPAAR